MSSNESVQRTQLAIIGAGPAGYPAAFHAASKGLTVSLIDPEANPGGVCLYRGCIPSKALLHVAGLLHELELAERWGVHCDNIRVDLDQLRSWKDQVVSKLTRGLGQLCKQRQVNYVRGMATFLDNHSLQVQPHTGDAYRLNFEHAIIATGSVPALLPDLPDSTRIMTSRAALDLPERPEKLLVIGAGYIGLELGQVYAALGSRVSVVEMLDEILPGVDRDLVQPLQKRLDKQFESILLQTRVTAINVVDNGLKCQFETADAEPTEAVFSRVMLAVGRHPNTGSAGLDKTDIKLDEHGFIQVDAQMRSSVANIYAIGDVAGEPMLAHKGTHEARVAVEAITGANSEFRPRAIPAVIFSNPELAWCGLTQRQAQQQERPVKITRFPWAASGRATTLDRNDGVTKLLLDPEDGRILGMGVAGINAGELIGQGVMAMEMGAVAEDLALMIQTHPTLSETIMEAAEAFQSQSTHYSGGGKEPTRPKSPETSQ